MIIDKNIHPQRDLYYLGGKTIKILQETENIELDFLELFTNLKKEEEITINLYSLVLDWLFILGVITKGENGNIKKCF